MFCTNCGREQPGESRSCVACGAPTHDGTTGSPESPSPPVASVEGNRSGPDQDPAAIAVAEEAALVARIRQSKTRQKGWGWFTAPIDSEVGATVLLVEMGKLWYVLAAMQLAMGLYLGWLGSGSIFGVLGDVFICLLAGYFLPRKKSQAFAVFLLLYAIGSGAVTVANKMNAASGGGSNVFLALIVVTAAYRGMRAAFVYHRTVRGTVRWRNVAIVWAIAIFLSMGAALGTWILVSMFASALGKPSNERIGQISFSAIVAACGLSFALLTRPFPFIARSEGEKKAASHVLELVRKTKVKRERRGI